MTALKTDTSAERWALRLSEVRFGGVLRRRAIKARSPWEVMFFGGSSTVRSITGVRVRMLCSLVLLVCSAAVIKGERERQTSACAMEACVVLAFLQCLFCVATFLKRPLFEGAVLLTRCSAAPLRRLRVDAKAFSRHPRHHSIPPPARPERTTSSRLCGCVHVA